MNKEQTNAIRVCLSIFMFTIIVMLTATVINLFVPARPTFRERCEENNGIFIENHGRAGSSCIYSKGE